MNVKDIKKIAVYGAGTIGGGFAAYFALKGLEVNAIEISEAAIEASIPKVEEAIKTYVKYGIAEDGQAIMNRIHFTTDPEEGLKGVSFVQENGPERPEIKHQIIATIEKYIEDDVIIASSSTGMPTTLIAEKANHPERIIVAHPFNPPYLIPLIEICKGEKTEQTYVDQAVEFYKYYDKMPIVLKKEKPGFVANRLAHALWREEVALVCEGVCTLEDADNAVCYGPGLRWGIMGPALGYELGAGDLGLGGMLEKFGATSNAIFKDLSKMEATPEEFPKLSDEQMKELISNLPEHVGHTKAEIASFRDDMLVAMLKMHKKL